MSKNSYGMKVRFLEAIEHLKLVKGESYRQISLEIGANEFYVSKVRKGKQGVTVDSLAPLEKKYGISQTWIVEGKGAMLLSNIKQEDTMKVVKQEHSEDEYEALRKEYDVLKNKLIEQMLKYQTLSEDYNKIKGELDVIKTKLKQG